MALYDTVKIILAVFVPTVFFCLLYTLAYLYQRHRSPYYCGRSRRGLPVWDSSLSESHMPRCHLCHEQHTHARDVEAGGSQAEEILGLDRYIDASTSSFSTHHRESRERIGATTISQPHFVERSLSIRRVSADPRATDEIKPLNSISSTLIDDPNDSSLEDIPACSSETLPFDMIQQARRRKASLVPLAGGEGTVEAMSMRKDVISLGERRPSVLSAGGGEGDFLPIRRVSAGGVEDVVLVRGHGSADLTSTASTNPPTQQPPMPALPLHLADQRPRFPPSSSSHPFSAESLSRSSTAARTSMSVTTYAPLPLSQKRLNTRPGSLTLVSPSTKSHSPARPNRNSASQLAKTPATNEQMRTALSTLAIKSPLTSAWSDSDAESSPLPSERLFEAWQGFPPKSEANHNPNRPTSCLKVHPVGREQQPVPTLKLSTSHSNSDPTLVPAPHTPIAVLPDTHTLATDRLAVPSAAFPAAKSRPDSTCSTSSRNSRITYLADVVRGEVTNAAFSGPVTETQQSKPHGRKSIVAEHAPVIPFLEGVNGEGEIGIAVDALPRVL